jgi:hypothetical protein
MSVLLFALLPFCFDFLFSSPVFSIWRAFLCGLLVCDSLRRGFFFLSPFPYHPCSFSTTPSYVLMTPRERRRDSM